MEEPLVERACILERLAAACVRLMHAMASAACDACPWVEGRAVAAVVQMLHDRWPGMAETVGDAERSALALAAVGFLSGRPLLPTDLVLLAQGTTLSVSRCHHDAYAAHTMSSSDSVGIGTLARDLRAAQVRLDARSVLDEDEVRLYAGARHILTELRRASV